MIKFDGYRQASLKEEQLTAKVDELRDQGKKVRIGAIVYQEDMGSMLYTRLKRKAAERVGIEYIPSTFSLKEGTEKVVEHIKELNEDSTITGVIIQKPSRQTWQSATLVDGEPRDIRQAFKAWWQYQTSQIEKTKDVDGLHPDHLAMMEQEGEAVTQKGVVLPATAQAVLEIIDQAQTALELTKPKVVILGKSDILGLPLYYILKYRQLEVDMIGSKELARRQEEGKALRDADIVVSATGRHHLITGEMVREGVVVIDVGEPKPDVDFESVSPKAAFITPVPGGVGPMTVVCLLENAVRLVERLVEVS